jgi:hypothetical protein
MSALGRQVSPGVSGLRATGVCVPLAACPPVLGQKTILAMQADPSRSFVR